MKKDSSHIRFCSLSSSSSGNCLFLESNQAKILIDVGIAFKKIETELEKLNTSISEIDAILITHDHTDHCKSLDLISKNYSIPIYINKDTWHHLSDSFKYVHIDNINIISSKEDFNIADLSISCFECPHDARDTYGFCIENSKHKVSIATDLGHVTKEIFEKIKHSDFIFLESNYDTNMLNVGRYPYTLKKRIASNIGHLSNSQCAETIVKLFENQTRSFMLGHLSKENNFPELALKTVEESLLLNGISLLDVDLHVANRDSISAIISLEK